MEPNGTSATAPDLSSVEAFDPLHLRDRVVIQLLFEGVVREEQVAEAWKAWRQKPRQKRPALWRFLMGVPGVDANRIREAAAEAYAFEKVGLPTEAIQEFFEKVGDVLSDDEWAALREARVVPVTYGTEAGERILVFGTDEPTRHTVNDVLKKVSPQRFEIKFLATETLNQLLKHLRRQRNEYMDLVEGGEVAVDLGSNFDEDSGGINQDELESQMSRSALINLFEAMLVEAVRQGVSDVHILPGEQRQVEILFRKNGELHPWHTNKRIHPEAFLAVIKDNTLNVDRFERAKAQDGFIQRTVDETIIRYRVSVLPITTTDHEIHAESVVIRVLDDRNVIGSLGELGLPDEAYQQVERAIRQPYGMVVLTGPTGSGKTTTLYAALQEVVTPRLNVITVEDPVEYVLPGVRQVKLKPQTGHGRSHALHSPARSRHRYGGRDARPGNSRARDQTGKHGPPHV